MSGQTAAPSGKGTQGRGQGRVPIEDPVGERRAHPTWLSSAGALLPGHKGSPQPGERRGGTCRRPALSRAPTRVWAVVERADSRSRYVSCEPAGGPAGRQAGAAARPRGYLFIRGQLRAQAQCALTVPAAAPPAEDFIPRWPACCGV